MKKSNVCSISGSGQSINQSEVTARRGDLESVTLNEPASYNCNCKMHIIFGVSQLGAAKNRALRYNFKAFKSPFLISRGSGFNMV